MAEVLVGQTNVVSLPLVAKADGTPITAGMVNFYLLAKDGDNAGKWYRGADTSWQAAEAIAGAATHRSDGHWYLSLPTAVWTKDVAYLLYAKEDGDLHIPVGENILPRSTVVDDVQTDITTIMGADGDTLETLSDQLDAVATLGAGATATTYTVLDGDSNPIDGVAVWVTTDEAGTNIVASGTTNDSGKVTFMLDSGTTYYMWSQKAGYNFTNPGTEVAP